MDLNRVILIGRLATDPSFKEISEDNSITRFNLAVKGDRSENHTDFIPIIAFKKNAEFISKYLNKGRLVSVEGSLQVRDYVNNEGTKKREFGVIVKNINPLERGKDKVEEEVS